MNKSRKKKTSAKKTVNSAKNKKSVKKKNSQSILDEDYIESITEMYISAPLVAYACYVDASCGAGCTTGAGTTYTCC